MALARLERLRRLLNHLATSVHQPIPVPSVQVPFPRLLGSLPVPQAAQRTAGLPLLLDISTSSVPANPLLEEEARALVGSREPMAR